MKDRRFHILRTQDIKSDDQEIHDRKSNFITREEAGKEISLSSIYVQTKAKRSKQYASNISRLIIFTRNNGNNDAKQITTPRRRTHVKRIISRRIYCTVDVVYLIVPKTNLRSLHFKMPSLENECFERR